MAKAETTELTYPLGTTARLTGLSPEVLRAWERRYAAVQPLRTPGGTRRYRASDLERLQLLKAAVDAGRRIGQIANLELDEIRQAARQAEPALTQRPIDPLLHCLEDLRGNELQRLLSLQLSALGPRLFIDTIAIPLSAEIGEKWADGELSIAAEHLATSVLRSLLGSSLQPSPRSIEGPSIVFATPTNERHELGIMMAALTGLGAGGNVTYLGTSLPTEELLRAVEVVDAAALALSLVTVSGSDANRSIAALRGGLSDHVSLWIGGSGAAQVEARPGVEIIQSLAALEQRVTLLREQHS